MPRQARRVSATGIYHVMLRGINRSTIFHDDEDCVVFLQILENCLKPAPAAAKAEMGPGDGFVVTASAGTAEPSSCPTRPAPGTVPASHLRCDAKTVPCAPLVPAALYSYCLMGNHLHLLLKAGSEPLSGLIKRMGIRFAAWYNHKYQRTGHLFQDRFRSEPVENDAYLLAVYRYIALNPVKAGLCSEPEDYPWCSYSAIAGKNMRIPCAALPVDTTAGQLREFIRSEQPEIHPFPEQIPDREAESILLKLTGLRSAELLGALPKETRQQFYTVLVDSGLSVRQISRLTGIPKSNIARDLSA